MASPGPYKMAVIFAACLLLAGVARMNAVQVYGTSGTGSTYTTAPADDFGFTNVALLFDTADGFYATGVYIGNGWMLSAYHDVRPNNSGTGGFAFGPVVLDGTTYSVSGTTAVRITDPSTHNPVDLALYRLTTLPTDPNLKTLVLASFDPVTNASLTQMGNGINRSGTLTYWDSGWNVVSSTSTYTYQGYTYGPGQSMRWGTAPMAGTVSADAGYGVTEFLVTTFSGTNGGSMGAPGDSGGGIFVKTGGTWQLCGILDTVGGYTGQPANTSVVGDETAGADLSYYRSEIMNIAGPPAFAVQPSGPTIIEGMSGTFTAAATGLPAPGYQWQRMPAGSGTWSNMTNISGTYSGVTTGTLTVSNATLAMNGDQFQCIASNGYLPNATSNAATLTVETGYTSWASTYFGSQVSGSAAQPAATPQGDSVPNAIKYLTDINPAIPMSAASYEALPVGGSVTISGTQYLTLTFRENQNIPGLTLTVQQSSDLQSWQSVTPASMQTIGTDPPTGDPIIQIEVQSNGGTKMFLRLQIKVS